MEMLYEYGYPSYYYYLYDLLGFSGTYYQDLGFLKFGIGGEYRKKHFPYGYKKTINGTNTTYELSYTTDYSSYTSYDSDFIDQHYDVHGDFYLPSLGLWGENIKYFQDIRIGSKYVTPSATEKPVNYEEHFKSVDYKDQENNTGYSGTVGIDLSLGTGDTVLAPYIYFNNWKYSHENYDHSSSGDKSAYYSTHEFKYIIPGATMFIKSLDALIYGSYEMNNDNYIRWETNNAGAHVTIDASAVYRGYKTNRNIIQLSIRKRFPFDSFYVIPEFSYKRNEYVERGLAYDKDKKELTDCKYEYNIEDDSPQDGIDTKYGISLNLRKDFGDDIKFGAEIEGYYRDFYIKTYYTSDSTVTYTERSGSEFSLLSPYSRIFMNMQLLKNLFISVSGSAFVDSSIRYPEKLNDNDKYTSADEIKSGSRTYINLTVKLQYDF
jgi:hypothetical protein